MTNNESNIEPFFPNSIHTSTPKIVKNPIAQLNQRNGTVEDSIRALGILDNVQLSITEEGYLLDQHLKKNWQPDLLDTNVMSEFYDINTIGKMNETINKVYQTREAQLFMNSQFTKNYVSK